MMRDRPTRAAKLSTDLALPWDGCIINDNREHIQCSFLIMEVFFMNRQLSTSEQQITGELPMERAQEIILSIQNAKEKNKITYMDIMEKMAELDECTMVSLSTLRRVCRQGAEMKASSFNYEEILIPIYNAVKALVENPIEKSDHDKELDGYRAVIRVQNEELDRLIELKEHLEDRVNFLLEQIEKKDRRMDEKDELIRKLMDKCL